jgi:hypothetical protein
MPMVTSVPVKEDQPDSVDLDAFLEAAGLSYLKQQYDHVVVYFSQEKADGTSVTDPLGFVWASGHQLLGFQRSYARGVAANAPNPYFLHETLHHLDGYNGDVLHLYTGIGGLHGANLHGYYSEGSSGETDFLAYYRVFIRGQLAELDGFRLNINWPSIPTTSDLYSGVFRTLRVYTGF